MSSTKKPQMRIWPIVTSSLWRFQLQRAHWADDMVRLGVLTRADIKEIGNETN